jgi:2',3'-cyclic-nucleotide 2'-phosphodiesterase (5'-nucleotidase family)
MKITFSISWILPAALLVASGCSPKLHVSSVSTGYVEMSSANIAADSTASNTIAPYKVKMEKEMNDVVGITTAAMMKGEPEGTLGNFVADLTLKKANEKYAPADGKKADICMLNNGGLRTSLPQGDITRGKVYELMPFDNRIVVLTLTGQKMQQLTEYLAAINGAPVAGITIGIKDKKPTTVKINGAALDINRNYKVVTSDYLAGGGDKMSFFKDPVSTEDINYLLRDAIIDHMKEETSKGNKLSAQKDGRIYNE